MSAILLWAHKYFPGVMIDLIVPSIIFMIGLAEYSQRVEDKKTIKALYVKNDPNTPDANLIKDL